MFNKILTKHLVAAFSALILYSTIAVSAEIQKANAWQDFYSQAPTIQVKDPMAMLVGSVPENQTILTIHLTDVALYSGHVCPGIASGYTLIKEALDALYPDDVPERGNIRVAAMKPSDLLDVASYITGARAFYGRDELNQGDLAVDPTLTPKEKGKYVMVFQRKDTGKAVKAVFNRDKIVPMEKSKEMKAFLERVLEGKASQEEKEKKWEMIQSLVKRILIDPPEGLFEISLLESYSFPETKTEDK